MKYSWTKYFLFLWTIGMVLGLSIYYPFLQKTFPILQASPLAGAFSITQKPELSTKSWLSGDFQANQEKYFQENPMVRPLMVRVKNEYLMRGFNTSPHPKVILGKDGYLFYKSYIQAYLGTDFVGEDSLKSMVKRLIRVQDKLQEKNIPLLLLLPPAKGAHIPEQLPRNYRNILPKKTNHRRLIELCQDRQVPLIDFSYFRDLEEKTGHLFYPKTGFHWSHYGAVHAADSMSNRINKLLNIRIPEIRIDSLTYTNDLRPPDNELGKLLNLHNPITYDTVAYPEVSYHSDSVTKRPRVLILGDSYYQLMFDLKIHDQIFHPESKYWHYFQFHLASEHTKNVPVDTRPNSIWKVLENIDIVLFVSSAQNAQWLGFGFLETVLDE